MQVTEPYSAGIIQPDIIIADSLDDVEKNLKRTLELIDYLVQFGHLEFPVKLIVAPEFFLQGWHLTEVTPSPAGIAKCMESFAIKIPGKETEKIGERCKKYNCYFVGAAISVDDHWNDRFFNIGFVINPEGKVILRYFKHNTITNQVCCSMAPHDMWDEWTKFYGDKLQDFFPLSDTPIGKIGVCQCYDRTFPEVARAFAIPSISDSASTGVYKIFSASPNNRDHNSFFISTYHFYLFSILTFLLSDELHCQFHHKEYHHHFYSTILF